MITEKRLEDALKFLSETDEQNAEANLGSIAEAVPNENRKRMVLRSKYSERSVNN